MNRSRVVATGIGLALLAVGGAAAWSIYLRPVKVQVAAVERDVPVEVFGLGTVEARVTSKIGFKVAGVLTELRADVGDRIGKGAVLARLDDREQSARVARAGAPDRTIVSLIVQQALSMGIFGYFAGLTLVLVFKPYFPRRLVLDPESVIIVFFITIGICLAASTMGIRLALKVDPAEALASSG